MKITDIRNNSTQDANLPVFRPEELSNINSFKIEKSDKLNISNLSSETASAQWQRDILLTALDKLENNLQAEDNHPLSKLSNAPIETFEEALFELSFLRSPKFKETASQAQANLKAADVLYLFQDDYN